MSNSRFIAKNVSYDRIIPIYDWYFITIRNTKVAKTIFFSSCVVASGQSRVEMTPTESASCMITVRKTRIHNCIFYIAVFRRAIVFAHAIHWVDKSSTWILTARTSNSLLMYSKVDNLITGQQYGSATIKQISRKFKSSFFFFMYSKDIKSFFLHTTRYHLRNRVVFI